MFFNGCIWTKYLHVFSHSPQFPLLRIFFSLRTSLLSKRGNVLEKLVFHRVEHIVICILQQTLLVASHEGLVQGNHTPVCQELIQRQTWDPVLANETYGQGLESIFLLIRRPLQKTLCCTSSSPPSPHSPPVHLTPNATASGHELATVAITLKHKGRHHLHTRKCPSVMRERVWVFDDITEELNQLWGCPPLALQLGQQ